MKLRSEKLRTRPIFRKTAASELSGQMHADWHFLTVNQTRWHAAMARMKEEEIGLFGRGYFWMFSDGVASLLESGRAGEVFPSGEVIPGLWGMLADAVLQDLALPTSMFREPKPTLTALQNIEMGRECSQFSDPSSSTSDFLAVKSPIWIVQVGIVSHCLNHDLQNVMSRTG
eukprot:2717716-Amphidinium_carterae.1